MNITVRATCLSAGGARHTETVTGDIPVPGTDLDLWETEHLVRLDPSLFTDQDGLIIDIIDCAERPDLVGRSRYWRY
ncbi:hypothetical protein [Mycolicibacterium mageritense]|uniref:hypothetical protein n=1 Tax=Mycolicibacterium mageritense TaxID=53462 RepID=UPI0011D5A4CD|nr:hypothetical protein [Mycolicibacterium mageritense]TXI53169.1 MAG: hypothetical protein E6Q55_35820 [Mycolicibacterium mageritense]